MSTPSIHLHKTLCAMRWIALMNNNPELARAIERDQAYLTEVPA